MSLESKEQYDFYCQWRTARRWKNLPWGIEASTKPNSYSYKEGNLTWYTEGRDAYRRMLINIATTLLHGENTSKRPINMLIDNGLISNKGTIYENLYD